MELKTVKRAFFPVMVFLLLAGGCDFRDDNNSQQINERLSLSLIKNYHLNKAEQYIKHLNRVTGGTAGEIYAYERDMAQQSDRSRLFLKGMETVQLAWFLYQNNSDTSLKTMAIKYADFLASQFTHPAGHFVEYEKAPWLTEETLWYTIPWGTAFSGKQLIETYKLIKPELDEDQLYRWKQYLTNTANWIHKNPIIGSYVFNCTIDLCHVLWKIGDELQNEDWKSWAIKKANELIAREVDEEGWIHGEHGVSPFYQLLGSDFVALFAWDTKNRDLINTTFRLTDLIIDYSTPTLYWNGNFGTRSNALDKIGHVSGKRAMLVSAAFKHKSAAHLISRYAEPSWSNDFELWAHALEQTGEKPEYDHYKYFAGINSNILRQGPWQAWFNNYEQSLWSKGFAGLWHRSLDQAIFSTLHSLPSEVEKAKLRLGDTRDWAGFPHIRIEAEDQSFDSHQYIESIDGDSLGNVSWVEPLLSRSGEQGGVMQSDYQFGDTLTMTIELDKLVGAGVADFHIMRKKDQYFTIWTGENLNAIINNRLPEENEKELVFRSGDLSNIGLQINDKVFCLQIDDIPTSSTVTAGLLQSEGLHTRNHGGARVRIEWPERHSSVQLKLKFYEILPSDI